MITAAIFSQDLVHCPEYYTFPNHPHSKSDTQHRNIMYQDIKKYRKHIKIFIILLRLYVVVTHSIIQNFFRKGFHLKLELSIFFYAIGRCGLSVYKTAC